MEKSKWLMILAVLLIVILFSYGIYANNEEMRKKNNSSNYPMPSNMTPLDMAGGLYPGGLNVPPAAQQSAYNTASALIKARDANGNVNPSGKIGFVAVGASNPVKEWEAFVNVCIDGDTSPQIEYVNGCIGGVSFEDMLTGSSAVGDYFAKLVKAVTTEGLTAKQVQVIWLKSDCLTLDMWSMTQQAYITYFADKLSAVLQKLYTTFPNLQVVYTSGRNNPYVKDGSDIYQKHGGPRAYFNQLGIAETIARQINNDPGLISTGAGKKAPTLIWLAPLYTEPKGTANSKGHTWYSTDVISDGLHPTEAGAEKVAQYLFSELSADTNTGNWLFV